MATRKYCAVFGCMISSLSHPEMTFFKLPGNPERRLQWLRLIHRDDLKNKSKFTSYQVCEKHFILGDILHSPFRKVLIKKALPMLMLPNLPNSNKEDCIKEDKQTQTDPLVDNENATKEIFTQTSKSLFINSPRERKLKAELLQCRKKIKLLENTNKTKKAEQKTFHQLCDKFLNDKLALIIKAQSKLKQHGTGNRYSKDYITYCLDLHNISPQAYRFLQNALCLPCPSTFTNYKRNQ